jgi:RNA polymerase sigma-70 factor (ECF subfamily)
MSRSRDNSDSGLPVAEEKRLIAAAQKGCAQSARRLIETHQDRLYAFVYRMVRHSHDSEEICQEAFLRAFSALPGFDFQYRFSTWLFTIAFRLCLNQMRRRKEYSGDVDFSVMESSHRQSGDAPPAADEAIANSDEARRLKRLIWDSVEQLPPQQRATVLLFYREQMGCQEIGRVLGMPAATVKSHLHRARARLREGLADKVSEDWASVRFAAPG